MAGLPGASPGHVHDSPPEIAPEMWFKDILRIARRIQQNSHRSAPSLLTSCAMPSVCACLNLLRTRTARPWHRAPHGVDTLIALMS